MLEIVRRFSEPKCPNSKYRFHNKSVVAVCSFHQEKGSVVSVNQWRLNSQRCTKLISLPRWKSVINIQHTVPWSLWPNWTSSSFESSAASASIMQTERKGRRGTISKRGGSSLPLHSNEQRSELLPPVFLSKLHVATDRKNMQSE